MRWDRNYTSSEVEDRRGDAPVGGGGGAGGVPVYALMQIVRLFGWRGMLVALVIAGGIFGKSVLFGSGGSSSQRPAISSPAEDELVHFSEFVFDDTQTMWRERVPGYRDATLVLFRNSTRSGCGNASAEIGPFYCPMDHKVYIDLSFYDLLRQKLGAPGDFAQAYVIAHEVGHHVQNQLGLFSGRDKGDSIAIELQADCLAGVWAKDVEKRGKLELGDMDEALNAASQIGDDTLQRKATGHVQPETWTHGSSAQRKASFQKGHDGGPQACGVNAQ